jgi:hypothetical protein
MRLAYIPSLAAAQAVSFRNPAALFDGLLVARHCGIDAEIVQRLIDNFPSWMVPDVEWPDEIVRDIAEVDVTDDVAWERAVRLSQALYAAEIPLRGVGADVVCPERIRLTTEQIERAKLASINRVIRGRRKLQLRGNGVELKGVCPRCGGKDRFWINMRKGTRDCRRCPSKKNGRMEGGDVLSLVQFLDNVSFRDAVLYLVGEEHTRDAHCGIDQMARFNAFGNHHGRHRRRRLQDRRCTENMERS